REAIDRVHRDAVAVRVNQLLVDPVAAALRELLDVQFSRGEHHLANRAVEFVAINVDVGEIVVSADFLNLAKGILQSMPVPQSYVLKPSLVHRQIGCLDARPRRNSPRYE